MTGQSVCVTGASGFIAAHVVRELLEKGYRVRGTVRNLKDSGKYGYLTALPGADERLELLEAELLAKGSYDDAVAGCEYVFHIASPYVTDVENTQEDLVEPAVQGTRNVLEACKKAGSVKRVVLTSSGAAITDEAMTGKAFSEADWNEKSTLDRNPYYYSKTLAERAAWDFVKENQLGFDLVVINPILVIGPSLGPATNTSNQILLDLLKGVYPVVMTLNFVFVDVRDVARAHVLLMERAEAKGRYICSHESWNMQEIVDLLRSAGYSNYKLPVFALTGTAGDFIARMLSYTQPKGVGSFMRSHIGQILEFDNSKIERELGMRYIPTKQSILETVEDLIKWGHLEEKTQ